METLAGELLRVMALALNLDENWFADKIDHHLSVLRALNYPHVDEAPKPGQMRAGAHTDYGSLTILLADNAPGGLEVRDFDHGIFILRLTYSHHFCAAIS
jgi:isopenicillin N synthase-like dioxygenase